MRRINMTTKEILESNGYLTNTLLYAEIKISEINIQLMRVAGRNFIYLLCDKDEVIYTGRTRNLYESLVFHKMDKKFTDVILLEYSADDISEFEKQIIKLLKPRLNRWWVLYGI